MTEAFSRLEALFADAARTGLGVGRLLAIDPCSKDGKSDGIYFDSVPIRDFYIRRVPQWPRDITCPRRPIPNRGYWALP